MPKQIQIRQEFLTQKDLLERGWTKKNIEDILVQPDFEKTYRGSTFSYVAYLYDLEKVASAESERKMNFKPELVNHRHSYIFYHEIYDMGWTEKMINELLPPPQLIRNWDACSSIAKHKIWVKNDISHELNFAVSQEKLDKNIARRSKLAATKLEKQKELEAILLAQKKSAEDQEKQSFLNALSNNNIGQIFTLLDIDIRVVVSKHIASAQKYEIYQTAKELGFSTNITSNKHGEHWRFKTEDQRQLFVREVIDFLALKYNLVDSSTEVA